ncbi:glycoside hydrolase family 6 protein [Luedemannella helvata]|uniref:Glucanase n=1 Tax=Luedemannella helvata TaxID=349315 RepID=A0ABP4WU46_9ACTN
MTLTRQSPPPTERRVASHRRKPSHPPGMWLGVAATLALLAAAVVVVLTTGSDPVPPGTAASETGGPVTSGAAPSGTARPSASAKPSASPKASASASGNPLAGVRFYGPNDNAAGQARAWEAGRPADAAIMRQMASTPVAIWFGEWNADPTGDVRTVISAAKAQGAVPVLVAYNMPHRDCGGHSGGGAASDAAYKTWITKFAAGVGSDKAVVILEPDALAQLCGDVEARYANLRHAVDRLSRTGAVTYLDAGHANWLSAGEMASRLKKAGVAEARGFALNVSNFVTTAKSGEYGESLAAMLPGDHGYVIDTSRNGNGASGEWCNPPGRALGAKPTGKTKYKNADAYLWVKVVGESDGECNGGPAAGQWMPEYALELAKSAGWKA